jgi:hypothetical protein
MISPIVIQQTSSGPGGWIAVCHSPECPRLHLVATADTAGQAADGAGWHLKQLNRQEVS